MAEQPIPLYKEQETFYVPYFEIKIQGSPLPREIVRDVVSVTYEDNVEKVDSFSLSINNWDAEQHQPKYTGGEMKPADGSDAAKLVSLFDPGKELQLFMGYQGKPANLRLMMTGYITTLEPDFPQSGAPLLTVRGLNVLDKFRKKQYTWAWEKAKDNKTDSQIAQELSRKPDQPSGRPGLGFEVRIDGNAAKQEEPEDYVFMNNQYPILFLMERARRRGYAVFVDEEVKNGDVKRFLYFGPSQRLRDVTYELEWGKSLLNFQPTLTTTKQLKKVTVLGWDRRAKRQIRGEAALKPADLNSDLHALAREAGREEVITDRPVHTKKEADQLARKILDGQLKEFVKATGGSVGLPDLRAGRVLMIKGAGYRFNGRYFVTQTTHTINDSGYRTTFNARREQLA